MSDKSDSNIINDKTQFQSKKMISKDEYETQSKKTTHDELLKLGESLSIKKNKEHHIEECIEKKKNILEKYKFSEDEINDYVENLSKNKDLLLLKIQGIVKDLNYIQEVDHDINIYYNKKINTQKEDIDSLKEENELLIEESEELELKNEQDIKKFTERITKLRQKIESKNSIRNILYILIILSNVHNWFFCNYGFKSYFMIWDFIFRLIFNIIYHIIFLIPNSYKLITNYDNYVYLYQTILNIITRSIDKIIISFNDLLYIIIKNISIHINWIKNIIFNNHIISSIIIGIVLIQFIKRIFN